MVKLKPTVRTESRTAARARITTVTTKPTPEVQAREVKEPKVEEVVVEEAPAPALSAKIEEPLAVTNEMDEAVNVSVQDEPVRKQSRRQKKVALKLPEPAKIVEQSDVEDTKSEQSESPE